MPKSLLSSGHRPSAIHPLEAMKPSTIVLLQLHGYVWEKVKEFYAPVTLSAPSSPEKKNELRVQTAETANGIGIGIGCWPPAETEPITKLIIPNSANNSWQWASYAVAHETVKNYRTKPASQTESNARGGDSAVRGLMDRQAGQGRTLSVVLVPSCPWQRAQESEKRTSNSPQSERMRPIAKWIMPTLKKIWSQRSLKYICMYIYVYIFIPRKLLCYVLYAHKINWLFTSLIKLLSLRTINLNNQRHYNAILLVYT